jgi:hypothetical protein
MIPPVARQIVEKTPRPPRNVSAFELLVAVLNSRTSYWVSGIALVLMVPPLRVIFGSADHDRDEYFLGLGSGAMALLMAASPIARWWRLLAALRAGPLGHAEVETVQVDEESRTTIDATRNGFARGVWRVSTDDGRSFSEPFEIDQPFARRVGPGSRLQVLVHPRKPKSTFTLALLDGTSVMP